MPVVSVGFDGAQAVQQPPVDLAYEVVNRSAPGFDSAGQPTVRSRPIVTTKRIRLAAPNEAQLTADSVWFSDHVYEGDALSRASDGMAVANQSTAQSPKPIMAWANVAEEIVGDVLVAEIPAVHRDGWDGEPIARVEARATVNGQTVVGASSTLQIFPSSTDQQPVLGYRIVLDLSGLPDNAVVTLNAKGWPLLGNAASVRDSAALADPRLFSPRTYFRSTARAAAPNVIRVAVGGVNNTAYCGPDPALAAASPAASIEGAYARAAAVLGPNGALDGCRIQLDEGTWVLATANGTAQTLTCSLFVEPAPGANPSNVIVEFGATPFTLRCSRLRFRRVQLRRMGIYPLNNSAFGHTIIDGGSLSLNGSAQALFGGTDHGYSLIGGVVVPDMAGSSAFASTATQVQRLVRGARFLSAAGFQFEVHWHFGCYFEGLQVNDAVERDRSGDFIGFSKYMKLTGTAQRWCGGAALFTGVAQVQNLYEYAGPVSSTSVGVSNDGCTVSTRHFCLWHNTYAGFFNHGRINEFYNETSGTLRSHDLISEIGNLYVSTNTKHDIFANVNGLPNASQRTGGWPATNGVGCRGNFARYDSASVSFRHEFPGLFSVKGLEIVGAGIDPKFVNPKHTLVDGQASLGGGDYRVQAGSPVEAMVPNTPLRIDLLGNVRSNTGAAGAYAAAVSPSLATGGGAFAPLSSAGIASSTVRGSGSGSFAPMSAAAVGIAGSLPADAIGVGQFAPLSVHGEGTGLVELFIPPDLARVASPSGAVYVSGRHARA